MSCPLLCLCFTGGRYGGGAGGIISDTPVDVSGGQGGCRIIWGDGRAFPATNTDNQGVSLLPLPAPKPLPIDPLPSPGLTIGAVPDSPDAPVIPAPLPSAYAGAMFQFQMDRFQSPAHLLPKVDVYIVDAFNLPPAATMAELRAAGKIMVCAFRWVSLRCHIW